MRMIVFALIALLAVLPVAALAQLPMSTEFTFQGQLKQSGVPLDGTADLLFRLYDAETGGNLVDSAGFAFVGVENGLFTVRLDFGASVFDGENRWLEVEVEFPSGEGNWTTLTPRQRITATPYALQTRGLYVNEDGDVGIGTTNPQSALHIQDDASRVLRVRNSSSSGGTAIVAEATAGSGYTAALDAYVSSPTGSAIYAFNEAESGNGYALQAETSSPEGVSIYGRASNNDEFSTGIGVHGRSDSDYRGIGVYGEATRFLGTGVRGENADTGNFGLLGSDDEGAYGRGHGSGAGVRGIAAGYGPAGHFVISDAASTEAAVKAHTPNTSGYAGYFTGGRNYFEGAVGIGTDNPDEKLHVTGGDVRVDGDMRLHDASGNAGVIIDPSNATGAAGEISLYNDNGIETVELVAAEGAANGGQMLLRKADGTQTFQLDAEYGTGGAHLSLAAGEHPALYATGSGAGRQDATLRVANTQPNQGMAGYITSDSTWATVHIQNNGTGETLWLENGGGGPLIVARDAERSIFWVDGGGLTHCRVLQIHGGADLSEGFDIRGVPTDTACLQPAAAPQPGMVVSIDAARPGKLIVSRERYDRKVAGIISGAGGVKPGMLMGQNDSHADGDYPVALTGRVYCLCTADNGPIEPGDLLTTSDLPGHAMNVRDHQKAQGAIIGKAMTPLRDGQGHVLVLVNLQ